MNEMSSQADAVIKEWFCRTIDKEATHGELAEACREIVAFFVNDGLDGSRYPIWLQRALDILVTLVESIGLQTNSDKKKVMTCISGKIRVALTDEAYHLQQNGPADPTTKRHRVVRVYVVRAKQQDPSRATLKHSTTGIGHLFSIESCPLSA